jgi:hypothetical protein
MIRPVFSRRGGDHGDAAVAAVTEILAPGAEQVCEGRTGVDDIVAGTGPALPGYQHTALAAPMMIWVLTLRR